MFARKRNTIFCWGSALTANQANTNWQRDNNIYSHRRSSGARFHAIQFLCEMPTVVSMVTILIKMVFVCYRLPFSCQVAFWPCVTDWWPFTSMNFDPKPLMFREQSYLWHLYPLIPSVLISVLLLFSFSLLSYSLLEPLRILLFTFHTDCIYSYHARAAIPGKWRHLFYIISYLFPLCSLPNYHCDFDVTFCVQSNSLN